MFPTLVIDGNSMGISTILEVSEVSIFTDEIEGNVNILCLVASHGTDEPLAAFALCHDIIVAGLGCEDAGIVLSCGNRCNETRTFVFA